MATLPNNNIPGGTAPIPGTPPIISTTGVNNQYNAFSNDLDGFVNTPDPYSVMFQNQFANMYAANQNDQNKAISSATATVANAQNTLNAEEAAMRSGIESRGESSGTSRYLPDYQRGLVEQVKESYDKRFQLLDQQEKIAIANAVTARQNADVKVMGEQLAYAKQLRAEKAKALQDAQAMEWEKYKFNNLSANQKAIAARAGGSGTGGVKYTPSELKKLRAAGIDSTDIETADNFLYNKGKAPKDYNKAYFEENYDTDTLWNLALKLGVQRKKNLSKQNEVNELFSNPNYLKYLQDMTAKGYDIDEIIAAQQ